MKTLKVAVSSPYDKNLYSLLVAQICLDEPGIELVGVCCLKVWSLKRILFEIKRLGPSLIKKIWIKYFSFSIKKDEYDNSAELRKKYNLEYNSLADLCSKSKISYLKASDPNDTKVITFLGMQDVDLILSIGSVILQRDFISIPKMGVINIHKGILPQYRGMGVTEWPLLLKTKQEDAELGVTSHLIELGVDTGPILLKKHLSLRLLNGIEEIESKYLELTVEAMHLSIKSAKEKFINKIEQEQGKGKQYFELHPRLKKLVENKLERYFDET